MVHTIVTFPIEGKTKYLDGGERIIRILARTLRKLQFK